MDLRLEICQKKYILTMQPLRETLLLQVQIKAKHKDLRKRVPLQNIPSISLQKPKKVSLIRLWSDQVRLNEWCTFYRVAQKITPHSLVSQALEKLRS